MLSTATRLASTTTTARQVWSLGLKRVELITTSSIRVRTFALAPADMVPPIPRRRQQQVKKGHQQQRQQGPPRKPARRRDSNFYKKQGRSKRIDRHLRSTNHWMEVLDIFERCHADFDGVNWATCMNLFKTVQGHDRTNLLHDPLFVHTFLPTLEQTVLHQCKSFQPRNLSNILHAMAKLQIDNHPAILNKVCQNVHWLFNTAPPQLISNTLWSLAKLQRVVDRVLVTRVVDHLNRLPANEFVSVASVQSLANTAWACATLQVFCPHFFSLLNQHFKKNLDAIHEATPQQLANLLWSCAKLNFQATALFRTVDVYAAHRLVTTGTGQAIANAAWSYAALKIHPGTRLFSVINDTAADRLVQQTNGSPQVVCNLAWACATLGHSTPNLFAPLQQSETARRLVQWGSPQEVSNLVWACATLPQDANELFRWIDYGAVTVLKDASPQAISTLAWSAATTRNHCPRLFRTIDEQKSQSLVTQGRPQAVANTAWAFATMELAAPTLFGHIENAAQSLVQEGTPQSIANTAWAGARLGHPIPQLLHAIHNDIDKIATKGTLQNVSNIAWAFAKQKTIPAPQLFQWVDANMDTILKTASKQSLSNIAYACVKLEHDCPPLFEIVDRERFTVLKKGKDAAATNATTEEETAVGSSDEGLKG